MRIALAAAVLAALTASAPAALAATPASGSVSNDQLTTTWTGTAYGQPFKLGSDYQTHQLCISPFCDSFTLTVKDANTALHVILNAPTSAKYVDVLVTKPDGSTEFLTGNDSDTFQEVIYKKAATGDYTFDIWPNEIYGAYSGQYSGDATLCPTTVKYDDCFVDPDAEAGA